MKHAGPEAVARLEPLLAQLRALPTLVETRPGIFQRKSSAFLHFHEDPAGLFADLKRGADFERFPVNTSAERAALVRAARDAVAARPPSRKEGR